MPYFEYGQAELEYLSEKDREMGNIIHRFGLICREVMPDFFQALVFSIVGQQITSKAQQTIWDRIESEMGEVTPAGLLSAPEELLLGCGVSARKLGYIKNAAGEIMRGSLDPNSLQAKSDEEICGILTSLKGVGKWTAEMLLIFSFCRPNVMSFGDFGIRKGLCRIHGHDEIDSDLFDHYRRLYSPYGTIASFYLWEAARSAP